MSQLHSVFDQVVSVLPNETRRKSFSSDKNNVAVIMDEFSTACFAPECNLVPIGTGDIVKGLDFFEPKMLICESAWRGNDYSWVHEVSGSGEIKPKLRKLLEECKKREIPTIFWNKEDPPHFEEFIGSAKYFDIVFTTEERMVEKYRDICGHDRIYVLPFAAQPLIHNPLRVDKFRTREVAFAGQYFAHKFPERRMQTEFLFDGASHFDFSIHSREQNGDSRYRFPEKYTNFLKKSLSYDQMVHAYKWYKIFLNVNSVHDSESMCARRVFELSAAKTIVLSATSQAISRYYPDDLIPMASDSSETRTALEDLLLDDKKRQKKAHLAWRVTMTSHTYKNRLEFISEKANELFKKERSSLPNEPVYRALIVANTLTEVNRLLDLLDSQSWRPSEVTVISQSDKQDIFVDKIRERGYRSASTDVTSRENDQINIVFKQGFNYGENYAGDLYLSRKHTCLNIVAKPSYSQKYRSNEDPSFHQLTSHSKVRTAAFSFVSWDSDNPSLKNFTEAMFNDYLIVNEAYLTDAYNCVSIEEDTEFEGWSI